MFTIGKYKGKTVEDVAKVDACYCSWFYNTMSCKYPETANAIKRCIDTESIYLNFGKYKNKSISYVAENDKRYIQYLLDSDWVKKNRSDIIDEINELP